MAQAARPRVVVIGAGFGGVACVRALASAPVEITLIDRNNHHLFQPLLYQVATAALDPSNISSPIRAMFAAQRNVDVLLGEVVGVDAQRRRVALRDAGDVPYDWLVIATGTVTGWFGHPDWARDAIGLKSLADAERLRERLLGAFEWAESRSTDASEVARLLTFVVVGGGASGVELAGAIRILAQFTLARDFHRIDAGHARVLLFEAGPALLAGYPAQLSDYAERRLRRLGVEVRTGTQVEWIDADGVVVGGERVASANVFWCAGVAATDAAQWLGARTGRHGAIAVAGDCRVPGHDTVFAIGDAAQMDGPNGKPLPGVAAVAQQQGSHVGRLIAARLRGQAEPGPFRYKDRGSLAIIGRSAAVADLPWAKFTGLPAWLLWAGVHLVELNGLRNRLLVYLQWVGAWLFSARGARVMVTGVTRAPPQLQRQPAE